MKENYIMLITVVSGSREVQPLTDNRKHDPSLGHSNIGNRSDGNK